MEEVVARVFRGADFQATAFREVEEVLAEVEQEEIGDMKTKEFLNHVEDSRIVKAIADIEKKTSGEIRIFVSSRSVGDILQTAAQQFIKLGMNQTKERNGVLIYIAPKSQKFAVIGDRGIHEKCGEAFWKEIASEMSCLLKEHQYTEALLLGVQVAGRQLIRYFPVRPNDQNELPDSVVRD